LYLVKPNSPPLLNDDGIINSTNVRNKKQLKWAEDRLTQLKFKIRTNGKIKSYIKEDDEYIVYADPRKLGNIKFLVYKKPLSKNKKNVSSNKSFFLKDNWKLHLKQKYENRLNGKKK
jgi:hypothetical protein